MPAVVDACLHWPCLNVEGTRKSRKIGVAADAEYRQCDKALLRRIGKDNIEELNQATNEADSEDEARRSRIAA